VGLAFAKQAPHANAVHGRTVEEEDHPLPRRWIEALMAEAKKNGGTVDWVNCGLCVDERGTAEAVDGVRRGSPADLWAFAQQSDNTLVIPTR
jgi:tRNA 2-thiouridine synthesizing protein D